MKRVYLVAVMVALGAGVITFLFARSLVENSRVENVDKTQVVVATVDIPEGTMITNELIQSSFTTDIVINDDLVGAPNDVIITSTEQLIGKIVAQDIYANEQINVKKIVEKGSDDAALSYSLKEGEVAYSITANSVQGVDGYITPGDTVDIVAALEDEEGKVIGGAIVFSDLKVLKVATYQEVDNAKQDGVGDGQVKTYASVTVKTNSEQAAQLYAMEAEAGSGFKLVLNSRADADKVE